MSSNYNWQDFCALYYDQAILSAKHHLSNIKSQAKYWDERLDEDVLVEDAAMEALQKAFLKYDQSRGASMTTFLSRIAHNELVNELDRETKSLKTLNDITPRQETEVSLRGLVSEIPEDAMNDLKGKLRAAILKLAPVDQSILGFFLEDPSTFVQKSVEALNVSPGYVSVRKNRALAMLPALMGVTASDYYDLYEEHTYAGLKMKSAARNAESTFMNPIDPQFNLDATALKLYDVIQGILRES